MRNAGLLSELKVIELANVLAGPSVGAFFAELGAMVIKVENILTDGDVTRSWKIPTESPESDISSYFSCVNWGKYSLVVNLMDKKGQEIIHSLVAKSDIVLVSYKPGDAEKLKVDYPTLKRINPRLIYAHITGYGVNNPRAGYDAIIQAESGFTYMNGEPDGRPTKMPVALMDILAAHQVKEAILLALLQREKSGEGQHIEVSLLQSGIASLANQATNWLVGGMVPQRMGSDHPNIAPYGTIFTTKDDKEIVLAVGTDKQFEELSSILGQPALATDPRFTTNINRVKHREALKEILQQLIREFERESLLELLREKNIPAGGVYNMKEVFEQPEAREILIEGITSDGIKMRGVRTVVFKPEGELVQLKPPPHLGEHTLMILKDMLGYNSSKIEELIREGVIYAFTNEASSH